MFPRKLFIAFITGILISIEIIQIASVGYQSRIVQAHEELTNEHLEHALLLTSTDPTPALIKEKLVQLKQEYNLTKVQSLSENNDTIQINFGPEEDLAFIMASQTTIDLEPDYMLSSQAVPTEPQYSEQWYLHNTGQTYHASATATTHGTAGIDINWQNTYSNSNIRGADVTVAVIDSGLRIGHPDLLANIWTNSSEISDGIDNDNNGLIDDIHGWNFLDHNNDLTDTLGHGTEAAGLIVAADNQVGIEGIASSGKVLPLKVLNDQGNGSTSNVIAAINYAIDKGAKVISMSFGAAGVQSTALTNACSNALSHGVMLVASAGNNNSDIDSSHFAPADIPGVMAIGSITNTGNKASFSNTGNALSLVTPGVQVITTRSRGAGESTTTVLPDGTDNYTIVSGTSFSAPMVAGAAALVIAQNPDSSVSNTRTILEQSAHDLGTAGKDTQFGYGLLDISNALQISAPTPLNHTPTITTASWSINPFDLASTDTTTLTIVASDADQDALTVTADFTNLGLALDTLTQTSTDHYQSSPLTPTVSSGSYTVPYAVSDHTHTATGSIVLDITNTPSSITITSPTTASTFSTEENTITLAGTVTGPVRTITINDTDLTSFHDGDSAWSEQFQLNLGTNSFIIRSYNIEHTLLNSSSIIITRTAPTTPSPTPTASPSPSSTPTITPTEEPAPTITTAHRSHHHHRYTNNDPTVTAQTPNTQLFSDIPNDHFASQQINDLAQRGAIQGFNGLFLPNRSISRGEFLKIALIDANLFTSTCSQNPTHFTDINGTFNDIITCAVNQHIIADQTAAFYPYLAITREQAIVWLVALRGQYPNTHSTIFQDVTNQVTLPYIEVARQKQWISGFNGLFYPNNSLSRAEAAKIIVNSRH